MQDSENPNSEIKFFSWEGAISAGGMGFSQSFAWEAHAVILTAVIKTQKVIF